ncbi:hypothetical protein CRE_17171 [Caenorhabditis remanei]|uniref:Uncharacterized protein n=1 Tax=Caenorhabditis remanei TaxID=31234 RepID=E3MAI7_CAERE|nr:hypothetical protein CRE_17171 [Caenorhabditis remanei]
MIRLSTVLVVLMLFSDLFGYSSPLVPKPGRMIRKTALTDIHIYGSITCKYGSGPAITFIQLWEQDLFEDWDDHLPETVFLDQTTYPFKYDVKGTVDGDEFPSHTYDFYLWAEHNCTSDRHTIYRFGRVIPAV